MNGEANFTVQLTSKQIDFLLKKICGKIKYTPTWLTTGTPPTSRQKESGHNFEQL